MTVDGDTLVMNFISQFSSTFAHCFCCCIGKVNIKKVGATLFFFYGQLQHRARNFPHVCFGGLLCAQGQNGVFTFTRMERAETKIVLILPLPLRHTDAFDNSPKSATRFFLIISHKFAPQKQKKKLKFSSRFFLYISLTSA
jgi:hypothetical protein